jgi:hypothetical protein
MTTDDEREWARLTATEPIAQHSQDGPTTVDPIRALGAIIVYLTLAPPIAVLLWRLALSPWLN